jgi:hypothetical protein
MFIGRQQENANDQKADFLVAENILVKINVSAFHLILMTIWYVIINFSLILSLPKSQLCDS